MAFRDFFPYWRQQRMCAEGGKLFVVSSSDAASSVHEIFFDDNIRYDNAKIVDIRDWQQPMTAMNLNKAFQLHLVRAEPFEAIMDPSYFIRRVEELEKSYKKRHSTMTKVSNSLANGFSCFSSKLVRGKRENSVGRVLKKSAQSPSAKSLRAGEST
ncbi:hypothetical protein CYMTET_23807 [Cymbomonas tetramitiformis]|uniref:Uncharacterized protein n=1 Tax=Cymbomonas tetramitiformis TaxID=36881 RepID=A0AAE0L0U4_9CHLO|nr:hypothetical protein CYMTET_23807 [Cymbomonas tetramitiformis]